MAKTNITFHSLGSCSSCREVILFLHVSIDIFIDFSLSCCRHVDMLLHGCDTFLRAGAMIILAIVSVTCS